MAPESAHPKPLGSARRYDSACRSGPDPLWGLTTRTAAPSARCELTSKPTRWTTAPAVEMSSASRSWRERALVGGRSAGRAHACGSLPNPEYWKMPARVRPSDRMAAPGRDRSEELCGRKREPRRAGQRPAQLRRSMRRRAAAGRADRSSTPQCNPQLRVRSGPSACLAEGVASPLTGETLVVLSPVVTSGRQSARPRPASVRLAQLTHRQNGCPAGSRKTRNEVPGWCSARVAPRARTDGSASSRESTIRSRWDC